MPWPACHRRDVAVVYRLAIERGACGEAYHAVAEQVPFRAMAEAIGRQMGVPTRSIDAEDAERHFGDLAIWVMRLPFRVYRSAAFIVLVKRKPAKPATFAVVTPAIPGPASRAGEIALVRLLARQAAAEHIEALRRQAEGG